MIQKLFTIFSFNTLTEKLSSDHELDKSMCHDNSIDLSFASSVLNEKSTFQAIAQNVLSKLGQVVLSKHTFDSSSISSESNTVEWLGIGTSQIWHGYPDARIRAGTNETTVVLSTDEDPTTPGNSLPIEAKLG